MFTSPARTEPIAVAEPTGREGTRTPPRGATPPAAHPPHVELTRAALGDAASQLSALQLHSGHDNGQVVPAGQSGPLVHHSHNEGDNHSRSDSIPPGPRNALAMRAATTRKPVPELAIINAVRRQMEAFEEKLQGQIVRVQQQSDKAPDAMASRIDAKLSALEVAQLKLDRRMAELSGNYKGLSEEMQTQIRRIDQTDLRFWEWRHQFESEVNAKFSEAEKSFLQLSSSVRVAGTNSDNELKRYGRRLQRLEGLVDERLPMYEDTNQNILNLHGRLSDLEQASIQDISVATREMQPAPAPSVSEGLLASLETQVMECLKKMDHFQEENRDIQSRVEEQEERFKSLRTVINTREEHMRGLSDRIERADAEQRLKEFQGVLHTFTQRFVESDESIGLMKKKLDSYEQFQEEVSDKISRLHGRSFGPLEGVDTSGEGAALAVADDGLGVAEHAHALSEALALDVKDLAARMPEVESKVSAMGTELQSLKGDSLLGPRINALVDQLKGVAPKILDHEQCFKELTEKVGRLEVEVRMGERSAEPGKTVDGLASRVGQVEAEVARLAAGGPWDKGHGE